MCSVVQDFPAPKVFFGKPEHPIMSLPQQILIHIPSLSVILQSFLPQNDMLMLRKKSTLRVNFMIMRQYYKLNEGQVFYYRTLAKTYSDGFLLT